MMRVTDTPMPSYLRDFLFYLEVVRGRSVRTVEAYYLDLRTFLRFLKRHRGLVPSNLPMEEIAIDDVSIEELRTVTLADLYAFLQFVARDRENNAKTRARKASTLRVFFGYLHAKAGLLQSNPTQQLDIPTPKKTLPRYLTLEQSIELLARTAEDEQSGFAERDYCMLTLFLNCGMRLSELVGISLSDLDERGGTLRVLGKGNKERMVYLNEACVQAIKDYRSVRPEDRKRTGALFLSRNGNRISRRRVQEIVETALARAGLANAGLSTHKLRHTAATLMYQHGHVDIRVLKEILGHENLATTEIYTHVSSEQIRNAASASPLAKVPKTKKKHD